MKFKTSIEKKFLYIWCGNRENPVLEFEIFCNGIKLLHGKVKLEKDFYTHDEIVDLRRELRMMK